jgi:flagellar biosynthesis/type III secretory pathway protein FliH
MLQNAMNKGYEEGFRSGRADHTDNWRYNYQSSYGYQDASYGYDSYYVDYSEYNYYFRQGFSRGYEDGYYSRRQYSNYSNGAYSLKEAIIGTILKIAIY